MSSMVDIIKDVVARLRRLERRDNSAVTGPVRLQNDGGESLYNGAFVSGDVEWDTSTGQPTSGSGVLHNEAGLFGVSNGVKTFEIDSTTGNAYYAGSVTAGNMVFGPDADGSGNNGIYIDNNDYWFDDGTFSLGNGGVTYNGSDLEVIGKVFSESSGRRIGLEGDRINFYDTGGVIGAYMNVDSSNVLTLSSSKKIKIESTGVGDDIDLSAGDALRLEYNGAGASSDLEIISYGNLVVKINQYGDIVIDGIYEIREGANEFSGASGTFQALDGKTIRVRGGIITDLDE